MQSEAATSSELSSEFSSVVEEDTLEPSPYHAALFHLRQGLQALCDLSPGADPAKKEEHEQLVSLQKQALQLLHLHFAPNSEDSGARLGDVVQLLNDFSQQLKGGGGSVEQTYVYMDHESATDWIQLCNTPSYVAAFRDSMPHSAIAKRLREIVGQVGLDVIALGPGDGKSEVRLVQQIREESDKPDIRLYLFDVSQPLLSRAFKHAVDTFNDDSRVFVCGIQGNFHHLPRYLQLHYTPARSHRRRVYMLLGDTIGNIDNEPQFFQSAFSGAAPGDLLILDAGYVFTDSMDPAEIEKHDPALTKPIPEGYQRWLGGPIQRYCKEAQGVSFSFRLDTNRPLAGSYGLQFIAKVNLPGMRTKEFCMHQIRRYKPEGLIRCMQSLGWEHVGQLPFGGSNTRPKGVFIFQKQLPKLKH